jgi:hypothetical protein
MQKLLPQNSQTTSSIKKPSILTAENVHWWYEKMMDKNTTAFQCSQHFVFAQA